MIHPDRLTDLPIFEHLPRSVLKTLAHYTVERSFARGQILFSAGSTPHGLLVIIEGRVRVVRGGGDRQHLIHEEGPGGALGEVPVFGGGTYPATAIAAEPTRCLLLFTEALQAAAGADPATALTFLRRLGERTRQLVNRVDSLASRRVNNRLAHLLLQQQHAAGPGVPFTLGRTHTEVAEELGTVREVLVRALRELRLAGVIASAGRGHYQVCDAPALERLIDR
jgi:CRP/FNR family transcriptional regulator, dissimilatory nitrate respiration regulator